MNRLAGAAIGAAGGAAGLAAMSAFFKLTSKAVKTRREQHEPRPYIERTNGGRIKRRHRADEPSNEALGRLVYTKITGREPGSQKLQKGLGTAVSVGYGLATAAGYGALRPMFADGHAIDVAAGAIFGTALWLVGDELAVPLLGLGEAPRAYPVSTHLQGLGAHLAFGIATAEATRLVASAFAR